MSQLGDEVGEAEVEADADGSAVPLDVVGVAVGDSVALALAEAVGPVGVGEPAQGVPFAPDVPFVASTARLGLTGTTRRAPIATVPVATAPTTDTADRPRRACFGTVITPSNSPYRRAFGSRAAAGARSTVTNHPESGHPF